MWVGEVETKPSVPQPLQPTRQVGFQNITDAVDQRNGRFITYSQLTLPVDSLRVTELALLTNYAGKMEKKKEKRPVGIAA